MRNLKKKVGEFNTFEDIILSRRPQLEKCNWRPRILHHLVRIFLLMLCQLFCFTHKIRNRAQGSGIFGCYKGAAD